jgi:hypothetical protein
LKTNQIYQNIQAINITKYPDAVTKTLITVKTILFAWLYTKFVSCGLFYGAVSIPDWWCPRVGWWMNNEFENIWKEAAKS